MGAMASTVLSGMAASMTIGGIIPGMGTAIGAGLGTAAGAISGIASIKQNEVKTCKSWYQGLYENAKGVTDASPSAGGNLASTQEKARISFATLFNSEERRRAERDCLNRLDPDRGEEQAGLRPPVYPDGDPGEEAERGQGRPGGCREKPSVVQPADYKPLRSAVTAV